jgi:CRP/FNR family transcriptional regulator, cyclic AMP receptor protein
MAESPTLFDDLLLCGAIRQLPYAMLRRWAGGVETVGLDMGWADFLGYAASATVLATFCMSTMIPLRVLALVSNVLFMAYGFVDHVYPVFILHALLFPVNALRLMEFQRLVRDMRRAPHEELTIQRLLPYMTQRKCFAGETLVRKGEKADRLYYLVDGQLEVTEFKKPLTPGALVGEIGVFAPSQERTATIVCRTDCTILELTESKAKQLYFQDRSFGFAVLQLIISRLLENNERLKQTEPANLAAIDIVAPAAAIGAL